MNDEFDNVHEQIAGGNFHHGVFTFHFAVARAQERKVVALDPKTQKAIDALVQQGAVIKTITDTRGTRVTEVMLLGKQFTNAVIEQLRWFPDLETLRCISAPVDDEFVARLDQFPRLRVLGLFNAPVTDAGLAAIAKSTTGKELRHYCWAEPRSQTRD